MKMEKAECVAVNRDARPPRREPTNAKCKMREYKNCSMLLFTKATEIAIGMGPSSFQHSSSRSMGPIGNLILISDVSFLSTIKAELL